MKIKYKPHGNDEWVEFDPATELVCPRCGAIKPIPFLWKPYGIVICDGHPDNRIAMFDINSILGIDFEYTEILVRKGRLDEENIKEWNRQRVLWLILYSTGGVPKWKVEPFPIKPRIMEPQREG